MDKNATEADESSTQGGAAAHSATGPDEASSQGGAATPPTASDTESTQLGAAMTPPVVTTPPTGVQPPLPPSQTPVTPQLLSSSRQPHSSSPKRHGLDDTLTPHETKERKRALARARLALAEARLAALEAEESDDSAETVISSVAAAVVAKKSPQLADFHSYSGASRTHALDNHSAPQTCVHTSESRRETLPNADGSPVTYDIAADISAQQRSPQLTRHSVRSAHEVTAETPPQRAAGSEAPPYSEPTQTPPRHSQDAGQTLQDLATAILEVARGGRPATHRYHFDLPIFNGSISEWLHFKAAYEDSASSYSATENMSRLRKSLKGSAMEAVKCLFLGSSPEVIIKKLECRFGRPNALILNEISKLRLLPKLTDSPREICIFSSKVGNIITTVQALNRPEYLHSPEMVQIVTDKLTTLIRNKWFEFELKSPDTEVGLVTLNNFLEREAELNARHARAEPIDEPPSRSYNRSSVKTFNSRDSRLSSASCKVCSGTCTHPAVCTKFKNMSVAERWETARSYKLCFRCLLKRAWKHRCRSKQCHHEGCEHFHHELLHSDNGWVRPQAARGEVSAHSRTAEDLSTADNSSQQSSVAQLDAASNLNMLRRPDVAPCCHRGAQSIVASTWAPRANARTLLKVIPVVVSGPEGEMNTFALLDDGSTVTLMTTDTARRIGASGPNEPFYIEAVAGARIDANNSQRVKFTVRGRYVGESVDIKARTIDRLDISAQSVPVEAVADCDHLTPIAEQLVYSVGVPTILIGQDNWALLLTTEVRQGDRSQPVASRTPLGWVLHGQSCYQVRNQTAHVYKERCGHVSEKSLDVLIQEHFSLESLGVEPRRPKADPESLALEILQKTTRALPEGGYETGMLWKDVGKTFPNNYASAVGRLEGVERRLNKDPNLKQKYANQIQNMINNGYAELAPTAPPSGQTWYLPHFPVLNEAKPGKVCVVHDAAARTHGVCLNDYLLTGPDLLKSLLGVLMRFRQKPVAVVADIKDMFLRIKVKKEDRDALRFLWRDDTNLKPTEYRMSSVLFGATSSPSTAIYVKDYNARRHQAEFPDALNPILRNHYMDDFLQSFDIVEEANKVSHDVDAVHRRGNFVLQKWTSNDPVATKGLATEPAMSDVCLSEAEKVLGLVWRPADDTLGFNFRKVDPSNLKNNITKRQLLKTAMSLYDPLGLVTPVTAQAKRILQSTWRHNVGWDDYLPTGLVIKWREWVATLKGLTHVQIPRCYDGFSTAVTLELHVFVDASELCYAGAAYWRSVDNKGDIRISLAAARGRIALLKITSVPRLELQAAVLGGRLARTVEEPHDRRADRRVFWSDSRTVLAWLRAGARSFKPFVAHRIAELEETTDGAEWHWVPTAHNVADDATRDVSHDFSPTHRWFCGPPFLYDDEETWPQEHDPLASTDTGEERTTATVATTRPHLAEALPNVMRFSSWLRLVRATARLLQFIDLCRVHITVTTRKRTRRATDDDPTWPAARPVTELTRPEPTTRTRLISPTASAPLAAQYTRRAELLWVRATQEESFADELHDITGRSAVGKNSRLRQLSLIIDDHGILRIRSRIAAAADVTAETHSPAVLDGNHYYCRLYIDWIHKKLHHSGVECVVNELRQHFWVLRLRPTVRSVIKRCQPCRIQRAVPPEPLTGNLPPCRLAHHQRAFTHTGLDYFGPLSITVARHHEKRYVALFTCLTTRAVHLEIAASLSTDAVVLALRRMMARRGCPESIWSDNGTNFHGADGELRRAALSSLRQEAEVRHIAWHFICPRAPFMGGAWERLVRSVKSALNATLRERHPHEDVLHTLLTEVEHTINSRPLSHVSVAPEDDTALTPNHFLLGGPSRVPSPGTFTKVDELSRSHWRASQRLADLFWPRWVREVLPELQNRREPHGRGETIKEGDIVVIVDSNLPRNVWPKGKVERVFPGADGVVRVVDVRTQGGIMRRPTKRLIILPVNVE